MDAPIGLAAAVACDALLTPLLDEAAHAREAGLLRRAKVEEKEALACRWHVTCTALHVLITAHVLAGMPVRPLALCFALPRVHACSSPRHAPCRRPTPHRGPRAYV